MAAFNYKFKAIKKVKDEQKKKVQKNLALVENEIETCVDGINKLNDELKRQREESSKTGVKKRMKRNNWNGMNQEGNTNP